jgi:hypothetical protein
MKKRLTKPAIELLLRARINGAVFPIGGKDGGSRRRLAFRLAKDGLLEKDAPFPITKAGLTAIEMIDNLGRKMSRFYVEPYEAPIEERRRDALNGIEMKAFLKTGGDTVALLAFDVRGPIEMWRNNKLVDASARSLADVYAIAEKRGRNW